MQIVLTHVSPHSAARAKMAAIQDLVADYIARSRAWADVHERAFASQEKMLEAITAAEKRTRPVVCLLDSRGKEMTSEAFATRIGRWRDEGTQQIFFCIGPADGWSEAARKRADLLLSLGRITLAHGIARVVLAEQIYRALTILAGHPYHRA